MNWKKWLLIGVGVVFLLVLAAAAILVLGTQSTAFRRKGIRSGP